MVGSVLHRLGKCIAIGKNCIAMGVQWLGLYCNMGEQWPKIVFQWGGL